MCNSRKSATESHRNIEIVQHDIRNTERMKNDESQQFCVCDKKMVDAF